MGPTLVIALMLGLVGAAARPTVAAPVGTSFTYQGELTKGGAPYQGSADFVFRLFNDAAAGAQVGSDISVTGLQVPAGGLFTVSLDFGAVFNGTALWLDVQVRTPPDVGYTALTPRQSLTAAPFALYSLSGTPNAWVSDASGINYGGSVGLGTPSASGIKLHVSAPDGVNPAYITNNSTNFATLVTRNFAFNGFGLYDDASDRHYLDGFLGLGTTSPQARLHSVGGTLGMWGVGVGNIFVGGYQAGVYGEGQSGSGDAIGVIGSSVNTHGVVGIANTTANLATGVRGQNNVSGTVGWLGGPNVGVGGDAVRASDYGGYFTNTAANGVALRAVGLAQVNTLQILGADLAESFPIEGGEAEPGTVLALGEGPEGTLRVAHEPYSRRVAGVVSGARGLDAGVVLRGKDFEAEGQVAVALSGRVWVKCDATRAPIRVGDLLTTAERRGHAMAATDRDRAYGATLGKAMTELASGIGMVLVLVNLQ